MELVNKISDMGLMDGTVYTLILKNRSLQGQFSQTANAEDPKKKKFVFLVQLPRENRYAYINVKYENDGFYITGLSDKKEELIDIEPRQPMPPREVGWNDTQRTRSQERAAHGRDGRGGSRKRKTARRRRRSRR